MPYYGQGDYYAAGGLGGFIKGLGKAAVGFLTGGPVGAAAAVLPSVSGSRSGKGGVSFPTLTAPPGGAPGGGGMIMPDGSFRRKRRRMNYTNVRALKRADRRIDGFVKEAKKALKHTNYRVVSKSAGKRGSRGVITKAEASRALRS